MRWKAISAPVLLAVLLGGLAGCEPEQEADNPRFFFLMAEHRGPEGTEVFEDYNARMRCVRWTCPDDATPEKSREVSTPNGQPAAEPNDGCACNGDYRLVSSGGLELTFHGPEGTARGATATTENGGLSVFYRGALGHGRARLSRARRLMLSASTYAYDHAGGFEVKVGEHAFVRGVFYSLPVEGE